MTPTKYNVGTHIVGHRLEWGDGGGTDGKGWKDICPCIRMNDYKCPMNLLIEYDPD